jgi:hypothetical protein
MGLSKCHINMGLSLYQSLIGLLLVKRLLQDVEIGAIQALKPLAQAFNHACLLIFTVTATLIA